MNSERLGGASQQELVWTEYDTMMHNNSTDIHSSRKQHKAVMKQQ